MTSRLTEFSLLDLRHSGRAYSKSEKESLAGTIEAQATELGERFGNESDQPGSSIVLLRDPDPLAFSFKFFALLDRGWSPVPIAPDAGTFQKERLREGLSRALFWDPGGVVPPFAAGETTGDRRSSSGVAPIDGVYGSLTSGTTSTPKLCLLGVEGARTNARAHAESLGITAEHTLLQSLPIHHSFGLVAYLFTALEMRCALDFYPAFLTFRSLSKRASLISRAVLHASPSQVRFILREETTAPTVLEIMSVGGGLADETELALLSERIPAGSLFVTYGLTEAGPRVTTGLVKRPSGESSQGTLAAVALRPGYVGSALEGVTLSVRGDDGTLRAAGVGQLCVRSPSLKTNLESSELASDGLSLVTRDRVELLPSGEVLFLSREEDLLKVGGISVYPRDVEAVVRTHPDISDCLILKRVDPLYDEVFDLVVESGTEDLDVAAFLAEKLTVAQCPKQTFVLPTLPRTALGKVDRARVREILDGKI